MPGGGGGSGCVVGLGNLVFAAVDFVVGGGVGVGVEVKQDVVHPELDSDRLGPVLKQVLVGDRTVGCRVSRSRADSHEPGSSKSPQGRGAPHRIHQ